MKILPFLLTASTVAIIGLITGCESTPTPQSLRTAELSADYQKLSAESKEAVAKGLISRGQDPKTVYMALGRPDLITTSADGRITTWTYHSYLPPETEEQKKEVAREIQRRTNSRNDPLQEAFEYFRSNINPHASSLNREIAPRAMGQSVADYAKYQKERQMAGPGAYLMDRIQQEEYKESLYLPPTPDAVTVKLAVIFIEQMVSDAIVNDSVSAFVTQ